MEHIAHVCDLTRVPCVNILQPCACYRISIVEHIGHITTSGQDSWRPVGRIERRQLVSLIKHTCHTGDIRHVPATGIEGRDGRISEHFAHGGRIAGMPIFLSCQTCQGSRAEKVTVETS